jgi:hypothetical protein
VPDTPPRVGCALLDTPPGVSCAVLETPPRVSCAVLGPPLMARGPGYTSSLMTGQSGEPAAPGDGLLRGSASRMILVRSGRETSTEYERALLARKKFFAVTYRSRIHERTISLEFLGIILSVLRLEVFIYNVYITNQFQTTLAQ